MKKMKQWMTWGMALMMIGALTGCGSTKESGTEKDQTIRIGVVQIMEHGALDAANKGFVDAVQAAKLPKKVEFIQQNAQGDQSNLKTIAQGFVHQKLDLIAAISTPAAQAVANETTQIPIVGTAISDYVTAKLAKTNEKPGANITGTTDYTSATQQVAFIQELLPQAKRVGVMYNSGEVNSQLQVEEFRMAAAAAGLQVREATVTSVNDIQQVATTLVGEVDVIYVPTDNLIASAMSNLVGVMNPAKIPVIVAAGTMVKDGGLASLSVDFYRSGYRAGEMAVAILKGEAKPETMPIEGQKDLDVVINARQVQELGITLPESIQKRAKME